MEKQYTFDEKIVSDLYKEGYGLRPGADFWLEWDNATADEKQQIWDSLLSEAESEAERERQDQLNAEAAFERHVERTTRLVSGSTREDAIRYMHDSFDTNGDVEYLEYILGVRYGYLSGSVKVGY
jgi:predicted Fe-S protein YdhL (DUF1289 family)